MNGLTFHVIRNSAPQIYFSTDNNNNPPGAGGSGDDADIYRWNGGSSYTRVIDASVAPYNPPLGTVNVDGYSRINTTDFYASFAGSVTIAGITGAVQDEDVVRYTAPVSPATTGTWSMFFDGSNNGLGGTGTANSFDLDAFDVVGGQLYFSTDNNNVPAGAGGPGDDADIYRWNGGSSYTRVVDATAAPYNLPNGLLNNVNVDGLTWIDASHFYLSSSSGARTPA